MPCHFLTRTFGSFISVLLPQTQPQERSECHALCLAISSLAPSGASSVCHFLTRSFRSILSVMLSALPLPHTHLREHHQCATSSHAARSVSESCSLPCHFFTCNFGSVISVPLPHTPLQEHSQCHALCLAISSLAPSGASSVCHFLTRSFRSVLSVMLFALPLPHTHHQERYQCHALSVQTWEGYEDWVDSVFVGEEQFELVKKTVDGKETESRRGLWGGTRQVGAMPRDIFCFHHQQTRITYVYTFIPCTTRDGVQSVHWQGRVYIRFCLALQGKTI
jgi:hypothetical protein